MEAKALVEGSHSQVEAIRHEFILAEINTAFTFARSAEILYGASSKTRADRVLSKAWEAYNEAVKHLKMLAAGRVLRERLTAKLEQVHVVLDGLTSNGKRKLRVIRRNGKS